MCSSDLEGLDQTRGWFYTLVVIAQALFDKPAFHNCVVNGLILAEDGKKMSKRLKNYPDPTKMLDQYGADAIRLYMLNSPAVRGEDLRFSEKGLIETTRTLLLPLWNALAFLTTYARIDGWEPTPENLEISRNNPLDLWILSKLVGLIDEVRTQMDLYDLTARWPHSSDSSICSPTGTSGGAAGDSGKQDRVPTNWKPMPRCFRFCETSAG